MIMTYGLGKVEVWSNHSDVVLSTLSRGMINRKLFKVEVTSSSITKARKRRNSFKNKQTTEYQQERSKILPIHIQYRKTICIKRRMTVLKSSIKMEAPDIAKASDMLNISSLPKSQKIYMLPAFRKRRTLNN